MQDIIFKQVDKKKEYDFISAWDKLFQGYIITSLNTKHSYKLLNVESGIVKLKFYNTITAMWQTTDYLLTREIFEKWYVTPYSSIGDKGL
ncbi:hypothetical protein PM004_14020 [Clostridium paraputrificum]|uniref:hypothetical protein n=1 Tax=Clostridium paraputrificum TaxID=29363 RepID=UPI00232FB307|nr:hypothetical protein [Clostridium paraputrificum]MDB2090461.1 hypothetical protein [Clostridium paraputrificum]MDB2097515.1 hypothetical protein [Clostridium paraputrificum]MDY4721529.1 hypothetical protein [Clostridium paraputrificum]